MAEGRVWLVSPFLTRPVAEQIAEATERAGVLDPKALSTLAGAKFAIRSITNLHAKVSLVDSSWGLVGSGNLTGAGLGGEEGGNYELGGGAGRRTDQRRIRDRREVVEAGNGRDRRGDRRVRTRLGGLATGSAIGDRPHTESAI